MSSRRRSGDHRGGLDRAGDGNRSGKRRSRRLGRLEAPLEDWQVLATLQSLRIPHRSIDLVARAAAFRRRFERWPAAAPWIVEEDGRPVLYAVWVVGAMYGNASRLYGAYPRTYLDRIFGLFPEFERPLVGAPPDILHVFAGSVKRDPRWLRLDLKPRRYRPEIIGNVYDVAALLERHHAPRRFGLVLADPPYSDADGVKYGTPPLDRGRAMRALAGVTRPGGFCVWLDTCWPMHRKDQWRTIGRVFLERSINHRTRKVSIFQRTGGR